MAANAKFKFRRVFGLPQQRAFFACKQTPRTEYSNPGHCIADRLVDDPFAAAASHSQPQLNQSRPFGCRPSRFRSRGPQSVSLLGASPTFVHWCSGQVQSVTDRFHHVELHHKLISFLSRRQTRRYTSCTPSTSSHSLGWRQT